MLSFGCAGLILIGELVGASGIALSANNKIGMYTSVVGVLVTAWAVARLLFATKSPNYKPASSTDSFRNM